jgi:hypothetical protein
MRVHLIVDNEAHGDRSLYTSRRRPLEIERSDMEYLSAIGPLLILMFFGGGLVIVAYLTFDDMRTRGTSFNAASFSASITSTIERIKALPLTTLIMVGAVVLATLFVFLVVQSGYYARPAAPEAAPATENSAPPTAQPATAPTPKSAHKAAAPAAAEAAVRTVTSSSCASDGCPVSCASNEILTSAYCVSSGTARLTDQLAVKDGVVTARCSPSASSIKVACAHK